MHALGGRGAVNGNIKTFSSFSRKKEMIVKKLSLGQMNEWPLLLLIISFVSDVFHAVRVQAIKY